MKTVFSRIVSATLALGLISTTALAEYRPPNVALTPVQSTTPGAARAAKTVVKVCTGEQKGVYFYASQVLAKFSPSVLIQPVLTEGSLENTQKVAEGKCDVAFTQEDALRVYRDLDPSAMNSVERLTAVHKEYVLLLCNREAKVSKLRDLRKGNVVSVGTAGTGSRVTWDAIAASDKDRYGPDVIETSDKTGIRALTAIADGAEVTCALWVTGLGNKVLKTDAQRFADKIVMTNITEGVDGVKDAKGKPIYTYEKVPAKTYGALMPSGLFGTNDASTFAVNAVFIGNSAWLSAHPRETEALLEGISKGRKMIQDFADSPR
jgi:hypothetical protein